MKLYEIITRKRYEMSTALGTTSSDIKNAILEEHGEATLQSAVTDAVTELQARIAERTDSTETAAAAFHYLVDGTIPDGMDRNLFKIAARVRRRNQYLVEALQQASRMNLLGGN